MNVHQFVVEFTFFGICLGAVMHLGTWFTSKGLHWLTEYLAGGKA